jgi:hypothetical protein
MMNKYSAGSNKYYGIEYKIIQNKSYTKYILDIEQKFYLLNIATFNMP